eukprot:14675585-Alexandrium_andersonii.AAC.1
MAGGAVPVKRWSLSRKSGVPTSLSLDPSLVALAIRRGESTSATACSEAPRGPDPPAPTAAAASGTPIVSSRSGLAPPASREKDPSGRRVASATAGE